MVKHRPCVVVADPLSERGLEILRREVELVVLTDGDDLHDAIREAEALVVRSRTQVTSELLAHGANLRLVARAGIGVDNVDVDTATERGILVINAPWGNVRSTAEHTIALIFALARRLTACDRAVRTGTWRSGYEGVQIGGKRLGLIGVGKVGSQVAVLAVALGMEVVAHDPYLSGEMWVSLGLHNVDFDELLETSDFVTVHVPLTPETRCLIGVQELARMKPGAYVLNCARGGLIDENALSEALASGQLAGAALDVFVEEPPHDSPLLLARNVILTPHVAASTREAQAQVATDIADQIVDFFHGKPVAYPVNPDVMRKA